MKPEEDHSVQTKQYDLKVPVLMFIKKKKMQTDGVDEESHIRHVRNSSTMLHVH